MYNLDFWELAESYIETVAIFWCKLQCPPSGGGFVKMVTVMCRNIWTASTYDVVKAKITH